MKKLYVLLLCFCMVALVFNAQVIITPPKKAQTRTSVRGGKSQTAKRNTSNRSRTTAKKTTRTTSRKSRPVYHDWEDVDSVAEYEWAIADSVADWWEADSAVVDSVAVDDDVFLLNVGDIAFPMKPAEGGTFYMGATNEQQSNQSDEKPVHEVTLRGFFISVYEVTQELWVALMGENPSSTNDPYAPVDNVSWNDVQTFIAMLNENTKIKEVFGVEFRLPTEAEWEYAARGGNYSMGYRYSGDDNINNVAWYKANSDNTTHWCPIGTGNELGLYDMSGNVWEWCQDWYGADYYSKSPVLNPRGPYEGDKRVIRGGGWGSNAENCRVAYRGAADPSIRATDLGFRIVFSIPNQ